MVLLLEVLSETIHILIIFFVSSVHLIWSIFHSFEHILRMFAGDDFGIPKLIVLNLWRLHVVSTSVQRDYEVMYLIGGEARAWRVSSPKLVTAMFTPLKFNFIVDNSRHFLDVSVEGNFHTDVLGRYYFLLQSLFQTGQYHNCTRQIRTGIYKCVLYSPMSIYTPAAHHVEMTSDRHRWSLLSRFVILLF